jgi:hypothetical protein
MARVLSAFTSLVMSSGWTHSTYAVIESRRDRHDSFFTVRRETLIGSSSGTNCSSAKAMRTAHHDA